jgi:DNA-binding CsgD family transcriptional regulator
MGDDRFDLLTDRELEILRMSADGLKPKMIASRLSLSERTVYAHLSNAAKRLGVSGPGEASALLARREALGSYSKPTKQILPVAEKPSFLVDLLLPELSGRPFNDLSVHHRIVVIVIRLSFVTLIMVALASLAKDVGEIVERIR